MAALERIMQMKQQGLSEPQIIDALKQEGISPREINEALSQSQIKSELEPQDPTMPMQENLIPEQMPIQQQTTPGQFTQEIPGAQMQQSIMGTEAPIEQMPSQMPAQQMPMQQEMPYYEEYQTQQATDIETINDIAEQIVEEKTDLIKKQVVSFARFKDELTMEVEKINERLSRIESTFNELQMAILRKIGGYGEDIKNIAKEMHDTQDSFSKMVNPLTDNIRELQKLTGSSKSKKTRPRPKTKSGKGKKKSSKADLDFEEYLR
tara:strand:+ start:2627 stop:3418 length:792 start_codon:yes stop_codon:yes gene_type:complete